MRFIAQPVTLERSGPVNGGRPLKPNVSEPSRFPIVGIGAYAGGRSALPATRAEGGTTSAQDPRTAKFGDMPQHAINAGVVDTGMPIGALARQLARLGRHPYLSAASPPAPSQKEEGTFGKIPGNEELESMNEELQTAKEELQSANEELTTVNDELHSGNRQLNLANSDLDNLLNTVEIPIVFLDAKRRIRRFTPQAQHILNVLVTD